MSKSQIIWGTYGTKLDEDGEKIATWGSIEELWDEITSHNVWDDIRIEEENE